MLSKDEEQKLEMFSEILEAAKSHGGAPLLGWYDIHFLVTKLKEANDELSKIDLELQEANKYNANFIDRYEGMY